MPRLSSPCRGAQTRVRGKDVGQKGGHFGPKIGRGPPEEGVDWDGHAKGDEASKDPCWNNSAVEQGDSMAQMPKSGNSFKDHVGHVTEEKYGHLRPKDDGCQGKKEKCKLDSAKRWLCGH